MLSAALLLSLGVAAADQSKLLSGFDSDAELKTIEVDDGPGVLSDQHVTQGARSLQIYEDQAIRFHQMPQEWSGYDALLIDI